MEHDLENLNKQAQFLSCLHSFYFFPVFGVYQLTGTVTYSWDPVGKETILALRNKKYIPLWSKWNQQTTKAEK